MNRMFCYFNLIVCVMLSSGYAIAQTSTVNPGAQSNTGGVSVAGSFTILSTVGQTSPPGVFNQTGFTVLSGFGYALDFPPTITNIAPEIITNLDTSTNISAAISDDFSFPEVWLFYREGGQTSFDSTMMTRNESDYQATIPDSIAGVRGIEFRITAVDIANNAVSTPWQSVQVRLPDKQLSRNHPGNSYRLVSFPLISNNFSVVTQLQDDLGAPDTTKHRLWNIDPSNAETTFPYREDPEFLGAGESVFLITNGNRNLTSSAGVTTKSTELFDIPLEPGWNMIDSPFNFAIPIQNVEPESLRKDLFTYNGSFVSAIDSLKPFEGYMIKVKEPVTLTIQPSQKSQTNQKILAKSATTPDWAIRIAASVENVRDTDNLVGVIRDAAIEWDRHERFEPPPIEKFVSVAFPQQQWQRYPDVYTTDFRPRSNKGYVSLFTVATSVTGKPVTLSFDDLPTGVEARLVDISLNFVQNLHDKNEYTFTALPNADKKSFRLVVGSKAFVDDNAPQTLTPKTFQLTPNFPNPFNPSTSIRFGLPKTSRVTVKIYNLLGKTIATLVDGVEMEAGFHTTIWEGRNRNDTAVPSGVYFYRLQAEGVVLTRKMTLVK